MQSKSSKLKQDVYAIFSWALVTPALAAWPFVSAVPAFTLWFGAQGPWDATLQLIWLVTGFWGLAGILIFAAYAKHRDARLLSSKDGRGYGLFVGAYASLWTALYGLATYYR
jgi:hypothetical protein